MKGIWKELQRHIADRGAARRLQEGGFVCGRFKLHEHAIAKSVRPLCFIGQGKAWSYIASWNNDWPVWQAANSGLRVELDVHLVEGGAEVGLAAGDMSTFLDRVDLPAGEHTIVLQASQASAVGTLVLRKSGHDEPTAVEVSDVRGTLIEGSMARKRGFPTRNPIDDLAEKFVQSKLTIVDVGANCGDTVAQFAATFPGADIWALEPHPETFKILTARVAGNRRVRLRRLALSDHLGEAVLHSYSNAAINSLSPIIAGAEGLVEGEVVPEERAAIELLTLQGFCGIEGIERIDVLKLDTQGHEGRILGAAGHLLRNGSVRYVLTELMFAHLYDSQSTAGKIIDLLETSGFKLFDFYDFVYDERHGIKWGDALFEYRGG